MVMGRPLGPLQLTESYREQLESMANSRRLPHGLVRRAEIDLLAAEGWPNEAVAGAVGVTRATVGKWRQRFLNNGLNGLYDELRSGAPRSITDVQPPVILDAPAPLFREDRDVYSYLIFTDGGTIDRRQVVLPLGDN